MPLETQFNPIEKPQLRALSKQIQQYKAQTGEDANVNQLLILVYNKEIEKVTGERPSAWKTYMQWKEEGYTVRRGEKAFKVWSAPVQSKTKETPDETQEAQEGATFYVCCLFCDFQVQKL